MTKFIIAVLALSLVLGGSVALAADKPNFSGNWKLNIEKSDFGPMPKPEKAEYAITHKDPELNIKSSAVTQMGQVNNEVNVKTDGKEFINTINGQEIKGIANWDGKTLEVEQKLDIQGSEIKIVQRWTLSEDGKSLTQDNTITAPQGELQQKAVLDKV